MPTPAVLVPTLEALVAIERRFLEVFPDTRIWPLQPRQRPTENSIWNWPFTPDGDVGAGFLGTGPTHEDRLTIRATVTVRDSADSEKQMWELLRRADAFLNIIDPALWAQTNPRPLGACSHEARRIGMSIALHPYGDNAPPVLGMDFPIEVRLRRNDFG